MNDSAVAAIKYALEKCDDCFDSVWFLRLWNEGDLTFIREHYEDVPDEVFIDADPLFKSPAHIEDGEEVEVVGYQSSSGGLHPMETVVYPELYAPLMTVAQHQRMTAALVARNEWLEQVAVEAVETEKHALQLADAYQNGTALSAPPASEQQRAVVMPELHDMNHHERYRAGWNACVAEFLRLNPHLAKGEGV